MFLVTTITDLHCARTSYWRYIVTELMLFDAFSVCSQHVLYFCYGWFPTRSTCSTGTSICANESLQFLFTRLVHFHSMVSEAVHGHRGCIARDPLLEASSLRCFLLWIFCTLLLAVAARFGYTCTCREPEVHVKTSQNHWFSEVLNSAASEITRIVP